MAKTMYKKIETITSKIDEAKKNPALAISYRILDSSVQADLRLNGAWHIHLSIDDIKYPADISKTWPPQTPWADMARLQNEISSIRRISTGKAASSLPASSKTKSGAARRDATEKQFRIDTGNEFLTAYAEAVKSIAGRRKKIADLQAQQKTLIKQMREANSQFIAARKNKNDAAKQADIDAIRSGAFWAASKDALKAYFHPPFEKNYLADVSGKWRAALFLECESINYKTYSGNWGHKLGGTGRGYLCGIDDNGDEWGHRVNNLPLSPNNHRDGMDLDGTVEEAMAELFGIRVDRLSDCDRQGDLLFCPCEIRKTEETVCSYCGRSKSWHMDSGRCPDEHTYFSPITHTPPTLEPHDGPWEIRESHTITSHGLFRNGRYFKSESEIVVTHTSHHPVILPPGEYRLYTLRVENAD